MLVAIIVSVSVNVNVGCNDVYIERLYSDEGGGCCGDSVSVHVGYNDFMVMEGVDTKWR